MPTSARRLTDGLLPACVGGGVPDAPCFGGAASGGILFASSGSGAEQQTMLSLGHGLPKIPLIGGKGSPETIRFLARFWVLFPRGKSAPPEAGQADSTAIPPQKKQSRTSHALLCSSHASSQNIEPQHHDAEDNQHNPRRAVERLRRGLIREHRRDPRPEEREHHAQRQHRPVRRAADGEV